MKLHITTAALILAASGPVFAQATPGTPSEVCKAYGYNSPAAILRLLKPAIKATLKEREIPAKQQGASIQCIDGALPVLREAVLSQCLVGQDPTAVLEAAFGPGVEPCLTPTPKKPTQVFPAAASEPVDPEGKAALLPAGEGLLPALRGEEK